MKFISENKISEELVNSFDEEMTLELPKRLKWVIIRRPLMV